MPTPALAAMSRTGTSTPEVTKAAAATSSSVSSLRRASARLPGADDPDPLSMSTTAPLPPSLHLANGTMFRTLVIGTTLRLFMMPEQASKTKAKHRELASPLKEELIPQRFDTAIPSNRARLDAVEQLAKVADEAGLTMIQLALGFVTAHPADLLDAIDAIVAPGVDLAPHEKYDTPPALLD